MEQSLSATSELIAPGGFKIRTLELRDYDSVAEIMNSYEDEGMTGDIMRKNHARWDQNDPRRVLVAEQDGRICGFLNTRRRQTDPQGQFIVLLFVHKDCCGQGLGRALLEQAQDFASANGGDVLMGFVEDEQERSRAFADKHGATNEQHLFESRLSLATFDAEPYLSRRAELEATGYRFTTLGEAGDNEENRRRLWQLDVVTDQDTPGFENWGTRTFEVYQRDEHESHAFTPDGVLVAEYEGDWVAMNCVRPSPQEGIWHTDYTGVRREHRGKGLALVLKALGATLARSRGAESIKTNNDSRNAAMIGINRKLGFQPQPGFYVVKKSLR